MRKFVKHLCTYFTLFLGLQRSLLFSSACWGLWGYFWWGMWGVSVCQVLFWGPGQEQGWRVTGVLTVGGGLSFRRVGRLQSSQTIPEFSPGGPTRTKALSGEAVQWVSRKQLLPANSIQQAVTVEQTIPKFNGFSSRHFGGNFVHVWEVGRFSGQSGPVWHQTGEASAWARPLGLFALFPSPVSTCLLGTGSFTHWPPRV